MRQRITPRASTASSRAPCGTSSSRSRSAGLPQSQSAPSRASAALQCSRLCCAGRYTIRASFLEIYNEQVRDLWNTQLGALQIREYPPGYWRGFYVEDLYIFECDCFEGAEPTVWLRALVQ